RAIWPPGPNSPTVRSCWLKITVPSALPPSPARASAAPSWMCSVRFSAPTSRSSAPTISSRVVAAAPIRSRPCPMPPSDRLSPGTQLHRIGWEVPEGLDEAMIRAVVDAFYARARRDDVIGPVFNRVIPDAEWPAHLDKIADFWSAMLLGSGRYNGRPMPKHMAIPELG